MTSKTEKYLIILTICGVLLGNRALTFAESDVQGFSIKTESEDFEGAKDEEQATEIAKDESLPQPVIESSQENLDKQESFLARLKEELNLTKTDYRQVLTNISDTKERLKKVSEEKLSLNEQLKNLDNVIVITTEKLINVVKQVLETENEIALLYEQIEVKRIALEYQKNLLKDYVNIIYTEENNYFTVDKDGQVNAFKMLLADGSVGTKLRELEYFDLLNEAGQQMVDKLDTLTTELEASEKDLEGKRTKLLALQNDLTNEKAQLQLQKESKQNLLELTLGQEKIYSGLLEQTIKEQEEVLNDVKNLSNALTFIERKMEEDGANFNPDDYMSLLDYRTQAIYNFELNYNALNSSNEFMWSIDPDRGISAYFHDSGYVGSFGVQHNAIDIPAYQGSTVRAAGDGVVYTAKDNDYGYSYIILAHANGFMTVYGHISNILVKEGDTIAQGSIIGLSGGMPGTKGAGYMTTGPHLHFEMLLNGLYVDPLDYMPLEKLTKEQIEDLPDKYYDDWETAVTNASATPISRF